MPGKLQAITAAAGAGKTTRIVGDIANEVSKRSPESILATTFTIKAADELVERARAELFRRGQHEAAARLLGARFGTVNAVCGQIVGEFALDLGRSPATAVIGETNEALSFSIAADVAIAAHAPILNRIADLFGDNDPRPPHKERPDWRKTVRSIVTLARANGIGPDELRHSAERSIESFLELLPQATSTSEALDAGLVAAIARAVDLCPANPSTSGRPDAEVLRSVHQRVSRGEPMSWSQWAKLTRLKCAPTKDGKAYEVALADVMARAGQHSSHPRLREDAELFIGTIFTCAADALEAYQHWKAERGLVDFTDQEALALKVLTNPILAERVRERIERVFVDEFQDSSPLQVALFKALGDIAEESTWVGDPKQAIYGFRGADTELTQAAFAGAGDDNEDVLSVSWRSRPGIIEFANALFGPSFERMGLPASRHAFSGAARSDVGFDRHPLAWWPLIGKVEEQAQALAEGIKAALEDADSWLVGLEDDEHRTLGVGDIAILCRSNTDVSRFATALSRAGLPVAVERSGLARTPHVEFVLAACRWVADPGDRLGLAEMARFFADDPESATWLEAAADDAPDSALRALVPVAEALEALRAQVLNLTPAELVDAVLALPEVIGRIEAWGDHAIRLDDLEALRGFAADYQAECIASGSSATLQGLLLAVLSADPKRPPSLAADAIQVMTYHGAKGLEWPMTVLTGLHFEPRSRLFEPVAEMEGTIDWSEPLRGRWIRYWPWPYGLAGQGSTLEVTASNSTYGQTAGQRAVNEETRLLYVGVTRARDYLLFAPSAKAPLNWLKVFDTSDAGPHLRPPSEDNGQIDVGAYTFAADIRPLAASNADDERFPVPTFIRPRANDSAAAAPLYLRPSASTGDAWSVAERIDLGGRLPIDGVSNMATLGEALHAILAYDDPAREPAIRLADARATLDRWGVAGFNARDALTASDRLHGVLASRWPGAVLRREAPVSARIGQQLVQGRIDLLIETGSTSAIVDHKSFPGRADLWETRALQHAPQIGLYAEAVEAASQRSCGELFVHMPIVGTLIRVARV